MGKYFLPSENKHVSLTPNISRVKNFSIELWSLRWLSEFVMFKDLVTVNLFGFFSYAAEILKIKN